MGSSQFVCPVLSDEVVPEAAGRLEDGHGPQRPATVARVPGGAERFLDQRRPGSAAARLRSTRSVRAPAGHPLQDNGPRRANRIDAPSGRGYVRTLVRNALGTHLRTHARLLAAGMRRQSTYRLAAFAGLVANATFGLLKVAILFATVRAAGGELAGYDVAAMSSYIWITQGMLGSVNLFGRLELSQRIKSGDVAVDFLRPVDVHAATITTEVGRNLFTLLPRGVPSVLIGALLVGMAVPSEPAGYVVGAVSLLLAIVVSCTTVYLVAVAGFWLVDVRGLEMFYMVVSGFLAGLVVPVWLFPQWLQTLAECTPFPSMLMYPADILSGRSSATEGMALVLVQLGWLVATVVVGQLLTRAGRRKVEVQGG